MSEEPGWINAGSLIKECMSELRKPGCRYTAHNQAAAVITVLRHRGLLNDAGVEIVRAEIGDRK